VAAKNFHRIKTGRSALVGVIFPHSRRSSCFNSIRSGKVGQMVQRGLQPDRFGRPSLFSPPCHSYAPFYPTRTPSTPTLLARFIRRESTHMRRPFRSILYNPQRNASERFLLADQISIQRSDFRIHTRMQNQKSTQKTNKNTCLFKLTVHGHYHPKSHTNDKNWYLILFEKSKISKN
jgi:hypothetical protein